MKNKKTILLAMGLLLVGTLLVLPSFANSGDHMVWDHLKKVLASINEKSDRVLVRVGDEKVTNHDFKTYKAYMEANLALHDSNQKLSDQILWKNYITERLLLQEAKERGLVVSLDEAKQYAQKMREVLNNNADQEAIDFQKKWIEATGLDEEAYWTEYAPIQYQEELSLHKLVDTLIEEQTLPDHADPDAFHEAFEHYKEQLYERNKKNIRWMN